MPEKIFENCQQNRLPEETDRQHMERIVKEYLAKKGSYSGGVHDLLAPKLMECNPEESSLTLKFQVRDWMLNHMKILHGGLMTTCCDMTMGLLIKYLMQTQNSVTVSLTMNFMRSAPAGSSILVTAKAEKQGRRIQFLSSQVFDAESKKQLADCTAVFM